MAQMASTANWPDRRALERIATTLRGRVFRGADDPDPLECLITDFSERGARLRLPEGAEIPDQVIVVVWSTGLAFQGDVRWRTADGAGLLFRHRCDFRARVPQAFLPAKAYWLKTRPKLRRPVRIRRSAMILG